jgi:ribosomal-protein-alanine N-acetyltransferase
MLETQRLIIQYLTLNQLIKYIHNDHSLEKELGLQHSDRVMSDDLKEALQETILPNVMDKSKRIQFCTLWTIILKSDNRIIGDLCFVGDPDEFGRVEIGYGTYEDFRGQGYMTEAVGALVQWALVQPGVKSVVASTEKDNTPSFRVLEKNEFHRYEETDTLFYWSRAGI